MTEQGLGFRGRAFGWGMGGVRAPTDLKRVALFRAAGVEVGQKIHKSSWSFPLFHVRGHASPRRPR